MATSPWTRPLNIEYSPREVLIEIPSVNRTENENATVVAGDQVTLMCNAQSNPPAEYEWLVMDELNATRGLLEHWENQGDLGAFDANFY